MNDLDYKIIEPKDRIVLFNGKDLSGWIADIPYQVPESPEIFEVEDGMLVTPGKSVGHIVSKDAYRNIRYEVDYRLPPEGGGGSVLTHVSKLRALRTHSKNIFPQSLDIKIRHKDAGDIYCTIINAEVEPARRPVEPGQKIGGGEGDARHIVKLVDAERPLGEWNTIAVETPGNEVRIYVNGTLVNEAKNVTVDFGKVALQATHHFVAFRRVEIFPLA